ncbi:hypothetical protein HUT18_11655 [Streptomyces sp. NA04227]|uniref:hypothetical protein n=1 Tax=Streptomyces sp. NA04227 TaxID=2742136 RepID=UPI0015929054|nr:hypothetical protein [Streptomyces sp. NA04227]QKW06953.1 hypothetical protein HUT18_11655 [Streptomyces sp. NA04227]
MGYTETFVCVDDEHIYPALVDLANRWNGWLSPGLTLDAVRQLAAHTKELAERSGHDGTDEIKVIDGPVPVVLHIRWSCLHDEPGSAANVVKPDENGRYWIGGWEWCWYEVADGPLFYTKKATFEAWKQVLAESARRAGEIVRTQMPEATSALLCLDGLGHIAHIEATGHPGWPAGDDSDGEDGYGPFDTETLGEADEVLRKALDHRDGHTDLEIGGWCPARDIGLPELHRIVFPPVGAEECGDGPLEKARERFITARRKLLTETVPYLVDDVRAACPDAVGIVIDPHADEPFVMFLVDDTKGQASTPVPSDVAQKVHDRLAGLLAFNPTGDDLTACGWSDDTPPHVDGAYVLVFPAE